MVYIFNEGKIFYAHRLSSSQNKLISFLLWAAAYFYLKVKIWAFFFTSDNVFSLLNTISDFCLRTGVFFKFITVLFEEGKNCTVCHYSSLRSACQLTHSQASVSTS